MTNNGIPLDPFHDGLKDQKVFPPPTLPLKTFFREVQIHKRLGVGSFFSYFGLLRQPSYSRWTTTEENTVISFCVGSGILLSGSKSWRFLKGPGRVTILSGTEWVVHYLFYGQCVVSGRPVSLSAMWEDSVSVFSNYIYVSLREMNHYKTKFGPWLFYAVLLGSTEDLMTGKDTVYMFPSNPHSFLHSQWLSTKCSFKSTSETCFVPERQF